MVNPFAERTGEAYRGFPLVLDNFEKRDSRGSVVRRNRSESGVTTSSTVYVLQCCVGAISGVSVTVLPTITSASLSASPRQCPALRLSLQSPLPVCSPRPGVAVRLHCSVSR